MTTSNVSRRGFLKLAGAAGAAAGAVALVGCSDDSSSESTGGSDASGCRRLQARRYRLR